MFTTGATALDQSLESKNIELLSAIFSALDAGDAMMFSKMMGDLCKEKQMSYQDLVAMMSKKSGNRLHSYLPRDANELEKMYNDPHVSQEEKDKIKEQQKGVKSRNKEKNRNNAHKKPKQTLKQKRKEKEKPKKDNRSEQDTKITPGTQIIVDEKDIKTAAKVTGVVIGSYVLYLGVKWLVAGLLAAPTGGTSLVLAAVTP